MSHRLEFVYGYHGCCKSVADSILSGSDVLLSSENDYDWLGTGIYFWEEAPARAYEWAKKMHPNEPAVIGAKIRLGRCLNLLDVTAYKSLRDTYNILKANVSCQLPRNGKLCHRLDCLVINTATSFAEKVLGLPYDTVRCPFPEGEPVFPGSSILDRSHIQIAVRNQTALAELFAVDIASFEGRWE